MAGTLDALVQALLLGGSQMGAGMPAGGQAPAGMLAGMMSGAEPSEVWAPPGSAIAPPAQRGAPKDQASIMGLLGSLMQRPGSPSPLGESNEAPADGGVLRKGSILDSLFNGAGAAAAPAVNSSGAEPGEAWSARPPTNDPLSGEPKLENLPMPRPRPDAGIFEPPSAAAAPLSLSPQARDAQAGATDGDALPAAARPIEGRSAPAEVSGRGIADSILGKIFDPNKAATWLALGSGFAGAGSVGTGMRRAFGNAVPAMAADRAQIKSQEGIAATYRALISKGVPPNEALAAATNPVLMKAVADKYFDDQLVPHEIGTDMLGNKIMGSFHKRTGTYYDAAGRPISASGGTDALSGATANIFAKGVKEYNSDLPPDEYMAQFSPEVQAQMKAYINGDQMPTGNPRLKGLTGKVKEWAQTYGAKSGIPVSDATFSEKRKFRTELGSTSPSTIGGQAKAFNQGIEHATALAKKLEELGNVDPLGIPSVAQGANWMRQAFSTKQTGIAKEAAAIGQTLAGEVGKLFSGNAGGGVHERELTRQRFNTITSPQELAGALEATLETMEGGLAALETQKVNRMGTNSGIELVEPKTRENMEKIRGTIRRLRGEESAPAAAAAPGLRPGQTTTINGVTIKRLN